MAKAEKVEPISKVSIPCDCGCSIFEVHRWEDNIDLCFYLNSFYAKQDAKFWSTFKRRCKIIWYTLIGKEYLFEDVSIKLEDFKNYLKIMEEMTK